MDGDDDDDYDDSDDDYDDGDGDDDDDGDDDADDGDDDDDSNNNDVMQHLYHPRCDVQMKAEYTECTLNGNNK